MTLAPPPPAFLGLFRRRLDKLVTIQQQVVGGNNIQKFQDWATGVPAALDPKTGVERAGALDPSNVVTTSVYTEYRAGVRPRMRVIFETRVLEIVTVVDLLEAHLIQHLVTKEAVS